MPSSTEHYFTLALCHPAKRALVAAASERRISAKIVLTEILAAWATAYDAEHLLDRSAPCLARRVGPLPDNRAASLLLQPFVRAAVVSVCRKLGITVTQAASSALGWWYGVAPGRYPNLYGPAIEVLACAFPPTPPRPADLTCAPRPAPKQRVFSKPKEKPKPEPVLEPKNESLEKELSIRRFAPFHDRRETAELLKFEERRRAVEQTASGPAGFSALRGRAK